MQMEQRLIQAQKLVLTQTMQQSLHCLQLPVQELSAYLRDAALSNPLLEVEEPPLPSAEPEPESAVPLEVREQNVWNGERRERSGSESTDFTAVISHPQSFADHLNEQLGQMKDLDSEMCARCRFLVGCLNSAGYLDCALSELAEELGCPLFDLEQALFVVQALDPVGVGARNLSECLLLQLAQSTEFNALNIHMVQSGLPLLAAGDYTGLAHQFHAKLSDIKHAAGVIRSLNPIPSRGFYAESATAYIVPEADIRREGDHLLVELNSRVFPQVTLNGAYCAMVGQPECVDAQPYLKEKMAEAKSLIASVEGRNETLVRLLTTVVQLQQAHFLRNEPLQPMTMKQVADALELNISTVSRAVKDKYVQFGNQVIALRSLFTASLQTSNGEVVSAEAARQQIRKFISAEDPQKPLSDEALGEALSGVGILLSRRTVAKYRGELGIPTAGSRKRMAKEML